MYVPNNRTSKYKRQKLIKLQGDIDKSITVAGDCTMSLSACDRSSGEKIRKNMGDLNSTISQFDLLNIYRILHPAAECTFFSSSHEIFSEVDHILGHKTHLNKFKRIEIIQIMFSDYNKIKLELCKRNIVEKSKNIERFKKHFKITHESKKPQEKSKNILIR